MNNQRIALLCDALHMWSIEMDSEEAEMGEIAFKFNWL